jgi:hypothetical protein
MGSGGRVKITTIHDNTRPTGAKPVRRHRQRQNASPTASPPTQPLDQPAAIQPDAQEQPIEGIETGGDRFGVAHRPIDRLQAHGLFTKRLDQVESSGRIHGRLLGVLSNSIHMNIIVSSRRHWLARRAQHGSDRPKANEVLANGRWGKKDWRSP